MILVTGGTGLLGSHLLFNLTEQGTPIKALYRNKKKCENVLKIFKFYDSINGQKRFDLIIWVECDVLDVVRKQGLILVIDFSGRGPIASIRSC